LTLAVVANKLIAIVVEPALTIDRPCFGRQGAARDQERDRQGDFREARSHAAQDEGNRSANFRRDHRHAGPGRTDRAEELRRLRSQTTRRTQGAKSENWRQGGSPRQIRRHFQTWQRDGRESSAAYRRTSRFQGWRRI